MKIYLAQMNSVIGDFEGNLKKMHQFLAAAKKAGADLTVFPECSLCGYPAQDLLDYPRFAEASEEASARLLSENPNQSFIFGSVEKNRSGEGRPYLNIAIFAHEGKILAKYQKRLLPSYDVFDEDRFFEPGRQPALVKFKDETIGLTICEDIWTQSSSEKLLNRYRQNPLQESAAATIFINISASPFEAAKVRSKREMLQGIARGFQKNFIYVNSVGANDALIFDGRSYALNDQGDFFAEGAAFQEDGVVLDTKQNRTIIQSHHSLNEIENIYDALVLGIRDYCEKQKFGSVVLGLSGGIDSSLVACLAADALGVENVVGVLMPSRFTSVASNEDALLLAKALQNPVHILMIEEVFQASLRTMSKAFEGLEVNVAEENLQSRARGLLLMALSNKFQHLVLTTGNKSEIAVGYCTLYGDTCGGLAPLADVYKTQVYELAREANRRQLRIPERVFTKAPTAELRANQKDQDTLPPYEVLDDILKRLIEECQSREDIIQSGIDREIVDRVVSWVGASEYKRFQMAPGLKVSAKAFGVGRRVPIVQNFIR